jgi:hypothetical protein
MPRSRWGERRHLERGVRAQRGSADHRLVDLEVVHQGDDLLREQAHRVAPHVARAVGTAVAEEVEQDDAVPAGGEVLGQRLVHARRQQEPGEEDHDARPVAVRAVGEALALVAEARHRKRRISANPGAPATLV